MLKGKMLIMALSVVSLSSCSGLVQHSMLGSKEGGYVSINADAPGMRALSDWQTGTINEARTPDGQKGSYYQLREEQEKQKTLRIQFKSQEGGE